MEGADAGCNKKDGRSGRHAPTSWCAMRACGSGAAAPVRPAQPPTHLSLLILVASIRVDVGAICETWRGRGIGGGGEEEGRCTSELERPHAASRRSLPQLAALAANPTTHTHPPRTSARHQRLALLGALQRRTTAAPLSVCPRGPIHPQLDGHRAVAAHPRVGHAQQLQVVLRWGAKGGGVDKGEGIGQRDGRGRDTCCANSMFSRNCGTLTQPCFAHPAPKAHKTSAQRSDPAPRC